MSLPEPLWPALGITTPTTPPLFNFDVVGVDLEDTLAV